MCLSLFFVQVENILRDSVAIGSVISESFYNQLEINFNFSRQAFRFHPLVFLPQSYIPSQYPPIDPIMIYPSLSFLRQPHSNLFHLHPKTTGRDFSLLLTTTKATISKRTLITTTRGAIWAISSNTFWKSYPSTLAFGKRNYVMSSAITKGFNLTLKDGSTIDEVMDASSFLHEFPRGAYTTMRTLHHHPQDNASNIQNKKRCWSIFQYNSHVQRMLHSCLVMNILKQKSQSEVQSATLNTSLKTESPLHQELQHQIDHLMNENIRKAIIEYLKRYKSDLNQLPTLHNDYDLKLTILMTPSSSSNQFPPTLSTNNGTNLEIQTADNSLQSIHVYTHVTLLPEQVDMSQKVVADIRNGSRVGIEGKDSIWVHLRDSVMKQKTPFANEVLLCESDGKVREGCSSNFFVVRYEKSQNKMIVFTANEGILEGTVQQLVLKVCNQLSSTFNVEVKYSIPELKQLDQWDECFITSTSRLVLPIDYLVIAKDCKTFVPNECWAKMEQQEANDSSMWNDLIQHSTKTEDRVYNLTMGKEKKVLNDPSTDNGLFCMKLRELVKEQIFSMSKEIVEIE